MRRSNGGFTLIEIAIAIFVLAIGLVSILAVFPLGIESGSRANAKAMSSSMAWEALRHVSHRARGGGALVNKGRPDGDELSTDGGRTFGYSTPYSSAVIGNVRDGIYRGSMGEATINGGIVTYAGLNKAYIWEAVVNRLGTSPNATPDPLAGTKMIKHPSMTKKIRQYLSPAGDGSGRVWEPYLHYVYIRTAVDTRGVTPDDGPDGIIQESEVIDEFVTYISDYVGNISYLDQVENLFAARDSDPAVTPTDPTGWMTPDIGGIALTEFTTGLKPGTED